MSVSGRAKLGVARYGLIIAVILTLAGGAAIGGAAMMYTDPPVQQVTEETNQQSISTQTNTTAVVTNGTPLYAKGQTLRNMPAYFFRATPNLTLRVQTSVPADQRVRISQRITLVVRGTREDQPFYRERRVLIARQSSVTDGTFESNATINMSALNRDIAQIRNFTGDIGTVEATLQLNVEYETNRYSGTLTASSPVIISESAYWLGADLSATRSHSETVTRRVQGSPNMRSVVALSVIGVGLLIAAGVVAVRSRTLDEQSIQTKIARLRFDEWISDGEIPTKSGKEYVKTESLEDLVDVAIDAQSRVIHDHDLDAYAVVQGDLVYYFTTDETEIADWFEV